MDNLFHVMDDVQVITRSRGVYKQSKVYRRGSGVYAGHGSGFVKLSSSGGTSAPNVTWVEFSPLTAIKDYLFDLGLGPGVTVEERSPRPGTEEPSQSYHFMRR